MLKGIPQILSPELLKVLCEMGHSDRLVISDGNFPAESMGKDAIVIRCDGHGVPEILDAILQVFPLDTYVEKPANLMQVIDVYKRQFVFSEALTGLIIWRAKICGQRASMCGRVHHQCLLHTQTYAG